MEHPLIEDGCIFCGQPQTVDLLEVWSDHNFMIETCCEGMHEWMNRELADEADQGQRNHRGSPWLRQMFGSRGVELRRLVDDDGHLIADFGLSVDETMPWRSVRGFIAQHHRHNRPPAGWKFGAGCRNGSTLIGVVSVGRPVSRVLDCRQDVLEVNRLCLSNQVPQGLRHNAASMLYAWAARQAERRGYRRLITYIRQDEDGHSLRAAGFSEDRLGSGGSWSRKSRSRELDPFHNTAPKIRYVRHLKPSRPRLARVA